MENTMQSKTLELGSWQAKVILMSVLLLLGGMVKAGPVTIDFDDVDATYVGLASYQEDGMTLNSNVPDGTLIDVNNIVRQNIGIFSGGTDSQSLFWGANGAVSTLTLAADNGKRFSIDSLDASSLYNPSGALTLTGTKAGGGTVSQVLNLNGDLSSYSVTGLGLVTSLQLSFDGTAVFAPYDVDNISLNVVPIPATVWLFASGLGMLGWMRRRVSK
jgi:hypothetical protein